MAGMKRTMIGLSLLLATGAYAVDQDDAWSVCQRRVLSGLVSPGSARFVDVSTTHMGGTRYRFEGSVDAQNTHGGLMRKRFFCYTEYAGSGEWRFLKGNGEPVTQ